MICMGVEGVGHGEGECGWGDCQNAAVCLFGVINWADMRSECFLALWPMKGLGRKKEVGRRLFGPESGGFFNYPGDNLD